MWHSFTTADDGIFLHLRHPSEVHHSTVHLPVFIDNAKGEAAEGLAVAAADATARDQELGEIELAVVVGVKDAEDASPKVRRLDANHLGGKVSQEDAAIDPR